MVQSLRDGLNEVLPPYAVPSRIELVRALPLTANGKIDRAALAAPEDQPVRDETAELTPAEGVVASVFGSVLGRSVVSPDDNFFELGGQSLIGIEAVRRLRVAFGHHLPIALLYLSQTRTITATTPRYCGAVGGCFAVDPRFLNLYDGGNYSFSPIDLACVNR